MSQYTEEEFSRLIQERFTGDSDAINRFMQQQHRLQHQPPPQPHHNSPQYPAEQGYQPPRLDSQPPPSPLNSVHSYGPPSSQNSQPAVHDPQITHSYGLPSSYGPPGSYGHSNHSSQSGGRPYPLPPTGQPSTNDSPFYQAKPQRFGHFGQMPSVSHMPVHLPVPGPRGSGFTTQRGPRNSWSMKNGMKNVSKPVVPVTIGKTNGKVSSFQVFYGLIRSIAVNNRHRLPFTSGRLYCLWFCYGNILRARARRTFNIRSNFAVEEDLQCDS
jgi:hypothetical protein